MIGPANFVDEIDCGSFFDLIDFPSDDDVEPLPLPVPDSSSTNPHASFPCVWPDRSESLPGSDAVFSHNTASDLSAELSVPYEDIVHLEWLSNFVEDSFSGGSLTMDMEESSSMNKNSFRHQFQSSSPVSVLESSSSCSGEKTASRSPEVVASGRCGRARSKRPRPPTFTPRAATFTPPLAMQLISPTSSVAETNSLAVPTPNAPSESENFAESLCLIKIPKQVVEEQKKRKKIKFAVPLALMETTQNSPPQQAVRKCMHCEITKTPQWRAGPMGPKSLCNACGVRYKSGRLFPEYRPAASPTFVPLMHSNSHKKVLEMRSKICGNITISGTATTMAN